MDDCLIVGAGVIGLSLAYELSGHGLRVRVVDCGEPGREASWAGAGILPPANPQTSVHAWERLQGLSHQLHAEWADRLKSETGIDTGYRRCGGIYLARSSAEAATLTAFAHAQRELQVDARSVSAAELVRLEPALQPLVAAAAVRAAVLLPDEAQLRNPRHLAALLAACRQRGVTILAHVAWHSFVRRGRRIESVRTSAGDLAADRICICSGAWTYELLRQLEVVTGILPIRGQMVLFRGGAMPFRHVLNEGSRYLVAREDGHVLAGSTEEEAGFDRSTTPEAIRDLTRFARGLVPLLEQFEVVRTWAGLRPGSFDGFPYIGAIPGLDNAFAAAGHFRSGLYLSTGTAVVLGQLIRGLPPVVDLSPFRLGRG